MSGRRDVIVVGAGHNGLAAAAYLAKGGCSVLVLERNDYPGGSAATAGLAPGLRASTAFQSAETLAPAVIKELGLKAHGLDLAAPGGTALATADGLLRFDGKGKPAGGPALSDADAAALRDIERFLGRVGATLAPLYQEPLPHLEALSAGDKFDLLKVGWRLRRLGRRDMQAAMRALPMAMRDFVEDRLEGDGVRALVAGLGSPGGWLGPYAAGTVFRALHDRMARPAPLLSGPVLPRGGMGALGGALEKAARAAGAELRLEAEVVRIECDGGVVRGVTLASGEHLEASTVVSDADPRSTLLQLVDPATLEPEFLFAARGIRARAGVALVSFGLDALPAAPGGATDAFAGRVQIGAHLAEIERAFDGTPAGRLPERPFVQLLFPTVADPSLADDGRHVATAWVQAVPRRIATGAAPSGAPEYGPDDGWQEGRETLAHSVVAVIDEVLPGFSDRIVAHRVAAPPDFEAGFAASNGCLYDADLGLDQALFLRPLPGWYGYRTPLRGLYLCGAGTHGGGGITALAGRNAAHSVLADRKARAAEGEELMSTGTPFHPRTDPLNKQLNWRQWSGYLAAGVYDDFVQPEYNAIRNKAALIDVSPLYKHRVTGPGATDLIQRVFTRNIHKCDVLQAVYTPWCDSAGKVMQEGTVFRFGENAYQVNAAEPVMRWLQLNAAGLDVEIRDTSAQVATLALQGPTSRDVLQACFEGEVADLRFFRIAEGSIAGAPVAVSRTGYTGDLGYELWLDAEHALTVWDALMQHGAPWGITPCGILAMDVARVEAGFVLLSVDYIGSEHALLPEHEVSPYELGMGWAVKLDKGPFVGRDALAAERNGGSPRRVVGIQIDWEPLERAHTRAGLMPDLPLTACREPVPVYGDGHHIGRVTTRCWSTLLKKYVGIATVDARFADPGTAVEMEITVNFRRERVAARVTDMAHFRPERLRA